MRKSDVIEQMAKDAGISRVEATKALHSFFVQVKKALKEKGGEFTLAGLGTIRKTRRKARKDQSVRTSVEIKSGETHTIKLHAGQTLKEAMDKIRK